MIKSILSKTVDFLSFIAIAFVICTVLIVDSSSANSAVSGKYSWFAAALLLHILAAFFIVLKNKRMIQLTIVDVLLSVFCLWGISYSYGLLHEFTLKLSFLLLLWIFYCICRINFSQIKETAIVVPLFIVLVGFIETIWGLGQLYGYLPSQHTFFKTTGSFYNSGPYGGFLALILPITFYYMVFDYKSITASLQKEKILINFRWGISSLTFFMTITIIPATMSRASWIASITGCLFVVLIYMLGKINNNIKLYLICHKKQVRSVMLALFVLSISFLFLIYHLKQDSADGRTFIWLNSIEIIKNHPQGVGVDRFCRYYGEEQIAYFDSYTHNQRNEFIAGNPEFAFNEYIQIAIEFGILPFILFITLVVYSFYTGIRNKQYAVSAGLISLLIFAFFSYPFNLLPFLIILLILIALCVSNNQSGIQLNKKCLISILSLITISFLISSYVIYNRLPMHPAYKKWKTLKLLNHKDVDGKLANEYQQIYNYLDHESLFLFEYAQCLNRLERYDESNEVLEKMKNISCDPMIYNVMGRNYQSLKSYSKAEEAFIKASLMVPNRIYPYYLLMKLYDEQRNKDKVLDMVTVIMDKEAKVNSPAVTEIKKEAKKVLEKYNTNKQ